MAHILPYSEDCNDSGDDSDYFEEPFLDAPEGCSDNPGDNSDYPDDCSSTYQENLFESLPKDSAHEEYRACNSGTEVNVCDSAHQTSPRPICNYFLAGDPNLTTSKQRLSKSMESEFDLFLII